MPNLMSCEAVIIPDVIFDNYLQGTKKQKKSLWFGNGTPQEEINLVTNLRNDKAMESNFIETVSHQGRRNPLIYIIQEKSRNWRNSYFSCLATL